MTATPGSVDPVTALHARVCQNAGCENPPNPITASWCSNAKAIAAALDAARAEERERCQKEAYDWIENCFGTANADIYRKMVKP